MLWRINEVIDAWEVLLLRWYRSSSSMRGQSMVLLVLVASLRHWVLFAHNGRPVVLVGSGRLGNALGSRGCGL